MFYLVISMHTPILINSERVLLFATNNIFILTNELENELTSRGEWKIV